MDIETINTPFSEIRDKRCQHCKLGGDGFYCKIARGKRWRFMHPCTIIMEKLCPRADKEASNAKKD